MSGVLTCLVYQHDPSIIVLAGVLCFLANLATVTSIGMAKEAGGTTRWGWVTVAGVAGGFGIWSTHFAAMLAYDPGLGLTFDLLPTLISLAVAFLSTFVASFLAISLPVRQGAVAAGIIFGIGVSCMHFVGMSAIEFGGVIAWSRPLIFTAIAASVLTAPFAFALCLRRSFKDYALSAIILALGIVAMHIIAMGAATLVPGAAFPIDGGTLSKPLMLVTIVTVSLSLIGSGLAASAIAQRAARSSKDTEANFQLLVRGVTDYAIYMLDPEGNVTNWNAGAERAKGYTAAEIVGCNFARFYSAEDQALGLPELALRTALEAGRFEAEGRRYRKDGSWFWAHVVIQPVLDDNGVLVGYAKITRNITREKEDSDRIAAVSRNLDLALENMTQGICLFDSDEKLILSNGRYREIFQFPEGAVAPGRSYWELVLQGYEVALDDKNEAEKRARLHYSRNIAAVRSGQQVTHHTASGQTIRTAFNAIPQGGWVATFEDISEQVRSEEQIAFMVRHDSLTQLPNRAALMSYLHEEVAIAEGSSDNLAVIGIDLNKFKQINDQLGHAVGDDVLRAISARLQELIKPHEMVARFGGDEFVAVKRYSRMGEVQDFLDRLAAAFSRP
jgi:PAS domain S-box-containing protein